MLHRLTTWTVNDGGLDLCASSITHFILHLKKLAHNLLKSPQFFSEQETDQQEQFDISEKLMQAKLQNLAKRIKTCSENSVTFAADISDLMNRLISGDAMVTGELPVVEANLDLVTDYDGN